MDCTVDAELTAATTETHWMDLVFDIPDPALREAYENNYAGIPKLAQLPITSKSNPLDHAVLCDLLNEDGMKGMSEVGFTAFRRVRFNEQGYAVGVTFESLGDTKEALTIQHRVDMEMTNNASKAAAPPKPETKKVARFSKTKNKVKKTSTKVVSKPKIDVSMIRTSGKRQLQRGANGGLGGF